MSVNQRDGTWLVAVKARAEAFLLHLALDDLVSVKPFDADAP
jgi:hypothetical protein